MDDDWDVASEYAISRMNHSIGHILRIPINIFKFACIQNAALSCKKIKKSKYKYTYSHMRADLWALPNCIWMVKKCVLEYFFAIGWWVIMRLVFNISSVHWNFHWIAIVFRSKWHTAIPKSQSFYSQVAKMNTVTTQFRIRMPCPIYLELFVYMFACRNVRSREKRGNGPKWRAKGEGGSYVTEKTQRRREKQQNSQPKQINKITHKLYWKLMRKAEADEKVYDGDRNIVVV